MTQRRSSRPSSTVKYSDFENDDDFTDVSPQPCKKLKVSKQDEASKISKKQASGDKLLESTAENSTTSHKNKRAPLSEKIYERELQEAMELSLLESGGSQDVSQTANGEIHLTESAVGNQTVLADPRERTGDSKLKEEETLSLDTQKSGTQSGQGFSHIPGTILLDERIETLPQETTEWGPAQRQARHGRQASKKSWGRDTKIKDDEESSDCEVSEEEESLSDALSKDDESDFDEKPKRKKATKTKPNRNRTPLKKSSKKEVKKTEEKQKEKADVLEMSLSNAGSTAVASTCASNVNKTSPSMCLSLAADNSTRPKASASEHWPKVNSSLTSQWKPPSRASSSASSDTIKSPANLSSPSSGLRLGLSRNQRVKPLHPSVQVG